VPSSREKFGVPPERIPDYLALVGDAADGYPGIRGIGAVSAARLVTAYGPIECFPPNILGDQLAPAMLFKPLATLRTDAKLFEGVESLRWQGPTQAFGAFAERIAAPKLLARALAAREIVQGRT